MTQKNPFVFLCLFVAKTINVIARNIPDACVPQDPSG